jgi:DNA-3-methyladenine glycosylase
MDRELADLLQRGSVEAARGLIGWQLYATDKEGRKAGGTILETEAYAQEDMASHSYKGRTPRTEVMFGPAGHIYVYFTYGMHWCMNIVTGPAGHGEAVLIRAIEPEKGVDIMSERRGGRSDSELTNGPAKVCQALGVSGADNGAKIGGGRFELLRPDKPLPEITATPRIGITKDTHRLWRFVAVR